MKPVILKRDERIIAVVPEHCEGPGWGNDVLWVHIENPITKELRIVCYQFRELNRELQAFHATGAALYRELVSWVPVEREVKVPGHVSAAKKAKVKP